MNAPQAKRWVLIGLATSAGVATVGRLATNQPPEPKVFIGAAFAGIVLTILAEAQPSLAGGFAVTALLTSVLVYGGPAIQGVQRSLGT